jgi:hypothetical protein
LRQIAGKTSDPDRALRNLLERDRLFTERLREQTRRLGLRAIPVEVAMTRDELAGQVAEALGLWDRTGGTAAELARRRHI